MARKSWRRATEQRIGPGRLTHGWNGPRGALLRLARPGEAEDVARLAETTGGPLDEWMHAAIEDGTASAALFTALVDASSVVRQLVATAAECGRPLGARIPA